MWLIVLLFFFCLENSKKLSMIKKCLFCRGFLALVRVFLWHRLQVFCGKALDIAFFAMVTEK